MQTRRLGNAEWISPADFAERCPYEPGTFWVGRDPTSGQPLGYIDDRHILLGSGNRAGKGTTTLINNLCLWPGSVVVVDPKGENATVTAARRGNGSKFCEGLGQKVCVLDPFGASKVDAGYRGSYNPLDELDPNDPNVGDIAGKIASAIVVENPNVKDPFWQQSARKMVKGIILHVLTAPLYEGRRNLLTVRQLINRGDREGVELLKADGATNVPSGHSLLWQGMSKNEALGDIIAGIGEQMVELTLADQKLFQSMLQSVDRETEWLDSGRMRECVASSSLRLCELKSSEDGVSLYLCLPEGHTAEHSRWLRMMLTLVLQTFESTEGLPASGHRCLMVMDEFLGLKRIEAVERAASYIAGFGITMVFVVQGFSPLKAIYGEGWEIIIGNCGLKIFFAVDEPFAREYISKMIGETEVRTSLNSESHTAGDSEAKSTSSSRSVTDSESESRSVGHTESNSSTVGESNTEGRTFNVTNTAGESDTISSNQSESRGVNEGFGVSDGVSRTDGWSTSWGRNSSHTEGKGSSDSAGWSPRKLWFREMDKWSHWLRENETASRGFNKSSSDTEGTTQGGGRSGSTATSTTENRSRGANKSETTGSSESHTDNRSRSVGEGTSSSQTRNRSQTVSSSDSVTDTRGSSRSITEGDTEGRTESSHRSDSTTKSESVQARRLISPEDIGVYFDRPDPGMVGFALVLVGGKRPTVVTRTPYFDDPFFAWTFDPHPDHSPPPRLIGSVPVLPPELPPGVPDGTLLIKVPDGRTVQAGDVLAEYVLDERHVENALKTDVYERLGGARGHDDFGFAAEPRSLSVAARSGGQVSTDAAVNAIDMDGADLRLTVNRREHSLAADPVADVFRRYSAYVRSRLNATEKGRARVADAFSTACGRIIEGLRARRSDAEDRLAGHQKAHRFDLSMRKERRPDAEQNVRDRFCSPRANDDRRERAALDVSVNAAVWGAIVVFFLNGDRQLGGRVLVALGTGVVAFIAIAFISGALIRSLSRRERAAKTDAWNAMTETEKDELIEPEIDRIWMVSQNRSRIDETTDEICRLDEMIQACTAIQKTGSAGYFELREIESFYCEDSNTLDISEIERRLADSISDSMSSSENESRSA